MSTHNKLDGVETRSEHEVRVQKVETLRSLGIEPWPQKREVTATTHTVAQEYSEENTKKYAIAGRVISLRVHGKTAFADVLDQEGRLQIYIKQDIVGEQHFEFLKQFVDLGDIVWASGTVFKTKTGEITLSVEEFALLSKSLHPLPEKYHGLQDVETRYRQRYLDLMSNTETRERFIKRSRIIADIRHFLEDRGYIEVETPMLHPIPGGAAARPFITHHNALGDDFYLRIAPELYLKRLVIGGFERVFEINRNFRNEGISTRHNPEFTMLEFYTAHKDYTYAMDIVEEMIKSAVHAVDADGKLPFGDKVIDFNHFDRLSLEDAVIKYGGLSVDDIQEKNIDATLKRLSIKAPHANASYGEKLFLLFEECAEAKIVQPTFVIKMPIEISPLAKRDPQNPQFAARFELFIAGMEISNAFTELNDPFDQAERFKEQAQARHAGNDEAHYYDQDFITALEYGLPPTVGVGIGIDRLIMLLTNTTSIKDVILFPTLKKK